MPIRVQCPKNGCGRVLQIKDELAGKKGRCPECGTTINIPTASEQPKPEKSPGLKPMTPPPSQRSEPAKPQKSNAGAGTGKAPAPAGAAKAPAPAARKPAPAPAAKDSEDYEVVDTTKNGPKAAKPAPAKPAPAKPAVKEAVATQPAAKPVEKPKDVPAKSATAPTPATADDDADEEMAEEAVEKAPEAAAEKAADDAAEEVTEEEDEQEETEETPAAGKHAQPMKAVDVVFCIAGVAALCLLGLASETGNITLPSSSPPAPAEVLAVPRSPLLIYSGLTAILALAGLGLAIRHDDESTGALVGVSGAASLGWSLTALCWVGGLVAKIFMKVGGIPDSGMGLILGCIGALGALAAFALLLMRRGKFLWLVMGGVVGVVLGFAVLAVFVQPWE